MFVRSMTFGEAARLSEESANAFDVGSLGSTPIFRVASSIALASEKVQRPMPNHLKMIAKDSDYFLGVSWSSDVRAQWAVRRQESVPLTPVDDDNTIDRVVKNPKLGRNVTSRGRCD